MLLPKNSPIIEVGAISRTKWKKILLQFDDANLYQTIEYGMNSPGGKNLCHFVMRRGNKIIGAAQVRIVKIPFFKGGIAYIYWGPLWQRSKETPDLKILYSVLNALYEEFVLKGKYLLRIIPNILENQINNIEPLLGATNHNYKKSAKGERTIVLDLAPSLEELPKNFRRNWRGHLNRAEKNNLKIVHGNDSRLYNIFQKMYLEMHARKKFSDTQDVANFGRIQDELSPEFKMQVFICYSGNQPVAGAVGTAIRDTGIYLLGATTTSGLKLQGSYLIQWHMLNWLKEKGCRWYDLGGIDPDTNPGVFHFKQGMGGKDVHYLGQFEACHSWISWAFTRIGLLYRAITKIKN